MDLNKGGISRGIKALSNITLDSTDIASMVYPTEDKLVILKNYLEKLLTLSPKQLIVKNNVMIDHTNIYINKKDDLKIRKKKTDNIINVTDNKFNNIEIKNITPYFDIYKRMTIKILNFINKLGIFNEFRTVTKIVGTIWLIIKLNKLKYNNAIFKQIKLEKNTIKHYCKKIEETIYFSYCENIVNDYNKLINTNI